MAAPILGTGASIGNGGGWTGDVTSISWDGIERASIATSTLGTTDAMTYIPGDLYDAGEITVEGQHDAAGGAPPIGGADATWTLTFSDASTLAASGFVTGYSITNALEEVVTFSMTIKLTGALTATP